MPENVEIERRFLVDGRYNRPWVAESSDKIHITQWYLDSEAFDASDETGSLSYGNLPLVIGVDPEDCRTISEHSNWTVRIRRWNSTYFLTLKGMRTGASASEYEWELPSGIAANIVQDSTHPHIEKNRYLWEGADGMLWEIDEFEGSLSGLIIAEVELEREDSEIRIPEWAGMELTHLKGWSNASLARMISHE
ncbi:MAG: CYTH domain-containing protein [Candidatus Poseidoniaceae archaeon]